MTSKTYKFQVRVKGCEQVFADGLLPGVIASEEVTFTSHEGKEDRFATDIAMALHDRERQILEEVVEVIVTEVEDETDSNG